MCFCMMRTFEKVQINFIELVLFGWWLFKSFAQHKYIIIRYNRRATGNAMLSLLFDRRMRGINGLHIHSQRDKPESRKEEHSG